MDQLPPPRPEPAPPAILTELRRATDTLHRHLENALVLTPEADGDEREVLARFLSAWWGWLAPTEGRLWRGGLVAVPNVAQRSAKAAALLDDLRSLGLSSPDLASIPILDELPPMRNDSERLGVAYVVEGSTLGGRVLQHRSAHPAWQTSRFLAGYGAETRARWSEFTNFMQSYGGHPDLIAESAASARATFASLHRWFGRCGLLS